MNQDVRKMYLNANLQLEQKLTLKREQILTLNLLQMNSLEIEEEVDKKITENVFLSPNFKKTRFEFLPLEENHFQDRIDKTLNEILKEQLSEIPLKKDLQKIIYFLIENLDELGFLPNFTELSNGTNKKWKKAREILKNFSPLGCGTENFQDFLDFQLKTQYKTVYRKKFRLLILENLNEIEKDQYLYKKLKIKKTDYLNFLQLLKSLKAYPAQNFYTGEKAIPIYPEGKLITEKGELYLKLNSQPILKLNEEYLQLDFSELTADEKKELMKMKREAIEFISALNFRNKTIEKAITLLINKQKDYILGKSCLQTYLLKDLAQDLSLHPSTLSRGLKDRYIQMPDYTVKKLKNFFCQEINSHSCDRVKSEIKNYVANETTPLTDQDLVNFLKEKEIKISRRTVAKYREELGIPASYFRKKEK
jgi:RNA polymerase sigma-54 factor